MDKGITAIPWAGTVLAQSASWWHGLGILSLSYVIGCFTGGYYLVRLRTGQDIRRIGSGSVGGRNVGRLLGTGGLMLTLLMDIAKGALVVWAANQFAPDARTIVLAMVAVVTGHIWPAQLRFHGGKGVATSLGALLVFDWSLCLVFVCLFTVMFLMARRTLLPGLGAFAVLPLASLWMNRDPWNVAGVSMLAALVLVAHRKNLAEEVAHWTARRNVHPKTHQPLE